MEYINSFHWLTYFIGLYIEICLLGIRLLSRYLSEKELHEIVSLMMEKEIRLRHPIDDRLLTIDEQMAQEEQVEKDHKSDEESYPSLLM